MTTTKQEKRQTAFHDAAIHFDLPFTRAYSGAEDYRLDMRMKLPRYVAVTCAQEDDSMIYLRPTNTKQQAEAHTVANMRSDIFPEDPIAVVDLDRRVFYEADMRPHWMPFQLLPEPREPEQEADNE